MNSFITHTEEVRILSPNASMTANSSYGPKKPPDLVA